MKEPECIIHNMSKCLNSGKEPEKGRVQWCGEVWWDAPALETLQTLQSVIAEMKTKLFYFLAAGFSTLIHRNQAHIIHTVHIPRLGLGKPNTHTGAFLEEGGLLIDFCIRATFFIACLQFESFLLHTI